MPSFLDDEELRSAAGMLALYHNTIWDWEGIQTWKESRIIDQISCYERKWTEYACSAEASVFHTYLQTNLGELVSQVNLLFKILPKDVYDSLPHLAIHSDYHPGNLKFKDRQAIGIFDFDWAMIDARFLTSSWRSFTFVPPGNRARMVILFSIILSVSFFKSLPMIMEY